MAICAFVDTPFDHWQQITQLVARVLSQAMGGLKRYPTLQVVQPAGRGQLIFSQVGALKPVSNPPFHPSAEPCVEMKFGADPQAGIGYIPRGMAVRARFPIDDQRSILGQDQVLRVEIPMAKTIILRQALEQQQEPAFLFGRQEFRPLQFAVEFARIAPGTTEPVSRASRLAAGRAAVHTRPGGKDFPGCVFPSSAPRSAGRPPRGALRHPGSRPVWALVPPLARPRSRTSILGRQGKPGSWGE